MAHVRLFTYNFMFLLIVTGVFSIIPMPNTEQATTSYTFEGLTIAGATMGGFTLGLGEAIGVLIGIIATVAGICIALTTRVLETGLEFSPFKLLALIIGLIFVGSISAVVIIKTSVLDIAIQMILIFPSVIMMIYGLVIDIGTWGGD